MTHPTRRSSIFYRMFSVEIRKQSKWCKEVRSIVMQEGRCKYYQAVLQRRLRVSNDFKIVPSALGSGTCANHIEHSVEFTRF